MCCDEAGVQLPKKQRNKGTGEPEDEGWITNMVDFFYPLGGFTTISKWATVWDILLDPK